MTSSGTSLAGQGAIKIGVQLKFLQAADKPRVKELCKEFFPIDYPEKWYNDITSDKKYFALSAVFRGLIVGVIIAEVKPRQMANPDDMDILSSGCAPDTRVAYLLSLGVLNEYRENGIGSLLIDSLLTELRGKDKTSIKALYLHVLCSNARAIQFYEKREFIQHKLIPGYYCINNKEEDGYCYVRYINGGQPPWSVSDYMRQVTSMFSKFNSCSTSSHHHHHSNSYTSNRQATQKQSSTPQYFTTPTQSVHSYANIVLNKLPKLLPTSLPKISSLFTPTSTSHSPSANPPDQIDEDSDHKTLSAASSSYSSTHENPLDLNQNAFASSINNFRSPSLSSLPRSGSISSQCSSDEFHDSLSSPSQLDSYEDPAIPLTPEESLVQAVLAEELQEVHQDKKPSNFISGFSNGIRQNPVSSLISSTLPHKLKIISFSNTTAKSCSSGTKQQVAAGSEKHPTSWSTSKKAVKVKSAFTKSFAKIKPAKNSVNEDEEVLNNSSGSDEVEINQDFKPAMISSRRYCRTAHWNVDESAVPECSTSDIARASVSQANGVIETSKSFEKQTFTFWAGTKSGSSAT